MSTSAERRVGAEVVTADGRVLRAAADEHPDLFWALRGGGGYFGVVTSFEFGLHELDQMIDLGLFFWAWTRDARRCAWPARSSRRCRWRSTRSSLH
jgi:FAD/FMN-containing dehydrogenase